MALAPFRLAPPTPLGPIVTGGTDIGGRSFGDRLLDLGFSTAQDIIRGGIAPRNGGKKATGLSPLDAAKAALLASIPGGRNLVADTGVGSCPGVFSVRGPDGRCINLGAALPGGDPFITAQVDGAAGTPVLGRFGTAMVPLPMAQTRLRCLPGQVLGRDNLCYEAGVLRKDERKWVPPTKPLLTGGEVRALRVAKTASGKLQTKVKSLQKMGLFPKPSKSKATPKAPAPHVVVVDTD